MTEWLAIAWVVAVSSFQGTIDENLAERLIGVGAAVGVSLRGLQFGAAAAGSLANRTGAGALVREAGVLARGLWLGGKFKQL